MTIEKRLEILERDLSRTRHHNRWLFFVIGTLLVGLIVTQITTMAARDHPKTIHADAVVARSYVLEDARGETRGGLRIDGNMPRLVFYDEKGNLTWSFPYPGMGL